MKKSRRMFSLAMLVCLIVGVSTGIRECIGAACALAFVNATLGLEDLEKKNYGTLLDIMRKIRALPAADALEKTGLLSKREEGKVH